MRWAETSSPKLAIGRQAAFNRLPSGEAQVGLWWKVGKGGVNK